MTEYEIFHTTQKVLKQIANVEIKKLQPKKTSQTFGDFAVNLQFPNCLAEDESFLWAEVKENLTTTVINSLFHKTKESPQKIVLLTRQVTDKQAEKLQKLDIQFCDTAGNAYFNQKGLYVYISGKKTKIIREKPSRLFDKSGLKIIFALLSSPDLITKDMRTIARQAGVNSISTVSDIFKDLEKQRFLYQSNSSIIKRKLINKTELLKRWVEGYIERLRPTLKPIRFTSRKFTGRWWDKVEISDYQAFWSGEKGGELLTKHLKPANITIYANSRLPRLQAKYSLVRDEKGNVEILEKFWTTDEREKTAPPLVVYADLIATADARNLETAQIIYEQYLAKLTETTA
jgi:hypothetical protein